MENLKELSQEKLQNIDGGSVPGVLSFNLAVATACYNLDDACAEI
ncbi:bacteriocin [Flavobacterium sp. N502540]|nr:bacteriocin [Flavobacterium sp. N502540]